jgi:hypothetical protein
MYRGHEVLHVDRPLPSAVQIIETAESLDEGSANQVGVYEHGCSGLVGTLLEESGVPVGACLHDSGVALLEKFEELIGTIRESSHLSEITHEPEGGKHIVGVLRSSGRFDSPVHNIFSLLDGELRAFDVVRKVSLVEGEDAGLERSSGMVLGSG